MSEFRLQLRSLRQAKTLSQEELAEALGISRQSIISLEHGEYLPSFPLLVGMIRFFDCPIDQLVTGLPVINREVNQYEKGGDKNMPILPGNPFQMLDRVHDEMEEAIERNFSRADWSRTLGPAVGAMNIHETEDQYELEIQAPGYQDEEISIEFTEDALTVSGSHKPDLEPASNKTLVRREWERSEFARTVRFAHPVKPSLAEAKLEHGTLTIVVPKVEPVKPKTTKVQIKKK
ncbi:MAG: Hsp20 family protein [Patescibacteria group bacterium]